MMENSRDEFCFPSTQYSSSSAEWSEHALADIGPNRVFKRFTSEDVIAIWKGFKAFEMVAKRQAIAKKFQMLANQWKIERGPSSSIEKLVTHLAYQQIIGLGPDVIPCILREMQDRPDHWSWALRAITGENPIKPESRGNLKKMAGDWLSWAHSQGLRW